MTTEAETRIWVEFETWYETSIHPTIYPPPTDAGGLPDGWAHHARLADYTDGLDMHLARRTVGGWVLLTHRRRSQVTEMFDVALTLVGLHAQMRALVVGLRRDRVASGAAGRVVDWLAGVLVALYDPTIAEEAAARVVLALGGPARVEPLDAQPSQDPSEI